jgi:hypothetical protein
MSVHDVLPFPLYHGTSSIFLPSIRKNGLGGVNPVAQLDVLTSLRHLAASCKDSCTSDPWWDENKKCIEKMAQQQVTAGMNWRHGAAYRGATQPDSTGDALTRIRVKDATLCSFWGALA